MAHDELSEKNKKALVRLVETERDFFDLVKKPKELFEYINIYAEYSDEQYEFLEKCLNNNYFKNCVPPKYYYEI